MPGIASERFDSETLEIKDHVARTSKRRAENAGPDIAQMARTVNVTARAVVLAVSCAAAFGPPSPAAVTDLLVVESGENAVLTWTTGAPPFRVLRSESPDFFIGNHLVAQGLGTGTVTDFDALEPGDPSYFYLVLESGDANPPNGRRTPRDPFPS